MNLSTEVVPVEELSPGDWTILAGAPALVVQVSPFMGAHDVVFRRAPDGNAATFHVRGVVRRFLPVAREQVCRDCCESFPYDPDADRCSACIAAQVGA